MAKIYSPPIEVGTVPEFSSIIPYKEYRDQEDKFIASVQDWAKRNSKDAEAGELISFPVGDGCAQYVVMSLKPLNLIHLPIVDKWSFQYANRLTAADVKREVKRSKSMRKLFSSKLA